MPVSRLQHSLYHRLLRVSAAVLAVVLLFESGLAVSTTADLARQTHLYLAQSVSMSASVQPTELNQFTAELTKQKQLLDAREAALREREIAVELNSSAGNERATFAIAAMLFILLVLIVTNYILDFWRSRPISVTTGTKPAV